VPAALAPAVRAVFLRLAEMIADARHQHLLTPEPLDPEAVRVLDLVAGKLRGPEMMQGIEVELEALTAMELRSTGSWNAVPSAQFEWTSTAIQYLEQRAEGLRLRAPRRLLGRRPGGRRHRLDPLARRGL